ncbi:MAG: ABC transporter permease [Muribaculaceae bacterium]|nr:ABC transporter permease [Muribaculaceae bacterium]
MIKRLKNFILGLFDVYCREFRLVISDAGIILFFSFLPLVYPIIYSLIYNPELVKEVAVVVVDNDRTPLSRELVRNFNACDQAWVKGYAANLDEARRAMAGKDCFAILEIPEGMEKKVGRGETAPAVLYCDMTLLLRYRGFLVAATNVMTSMGSELLTQKIDEVAPLAETVVSGDLLDIENINMGNIRGGFDTFIMPGVIILILQQCIILACGMAGGAKRERRRLTGYNSDNMARSILATMLGQALCYLTILALPIFFMIHYVPLIFSFPMAGNTLEEVALILPLFLASVGLGFSFQAFVTEREAVFVNWVVTSLIFLFLSGLIWPIYAMPQPWKTLSALCPATWGVEGFVKMNANGSSLAQVSNDYINLWILTIFWWIVAYCVQRWVVRPALRREVKAGFQGPDLG